MSRGDPERVPDLAAVSGRDSADPVSSLNCGQTQPFVCSSFSKEEEEGQGTSAWHLQGEVLFRGREQEVRDRRAMKERIPGIVDLQVGMSTGWAGPENQVVMTVDFATRADFDVP